MSPEYAMHGQFSEKSDIYSFGVMILEIVTGKRNRSSYTLHQFTDGFLNYVSIMILEVLFSLLLYIMFLENWLDILYFYRMLDY